MNIAEVPALVYNYGIFIKLQRKEENAIFLSERQLLFFRTDAGSSSPSPGRASALWSF